MLISYCCVLVLKSCYGALITFMFKDHVVQSIVCLQHLSQEGIQSEFRLKEHALMLSKIWIQFTSILLL